MLLKVHSKRQSLVKSGTLNANAQAQARVPLLVAFGNKIEELQNFVLVTGSQGLGLCDPVTKQSFDPVLLEVFSAKLCF